MTARVLLLSSIEGIAERIRPVLRRHRVDELLFSASIMPSFISPEKALYDYFIYCFDSPSQTKSYGFVADMISECFTDPTKVIFYLDDSKGPVPLTEYFASIFVPNMPVFSVPDIESIGEIVDKGMRLSGEAAILEG